MSISNIFKIVLLKFLLFFSISTINLVAQDIQYAREIIEKLCAPEFHGRGYVLDGDGKAAGFIASQFAEFGLASYKEGYFQKFDISVNTLPGAIEVNMDNVALAAGKDYLVNPCSPSVKGTFQVIEVSTNVLLNAEMLKKQLKKAKGKFLLIDRTAFKDEAKENLIRINEVVNTLKYGDDIPAAGIMELTDEKLTWHASENVCKIPLFTIYVATSLPKINTVTCQVENQYLSKYNTQNVIGYIKGNKNPDEIIVISAHYDHLGRMGKDIYFPGANDNASGTALMLDLARHYSLTENAPPFTLVFMAFGAEEIGLLGSRYYVQNPLFPLSDIKFLLNLDIAGTGDEGITVVNGKIHENEFNLLKKINDKQNLLPQVKGRGEACNSDHCMFHLNNVPSFFIYTLGGIKAYHDIYDLPQTLPLMKYEAYFKLLDHFISELFLK